MKKRCVLNVSVGYWYPRGHDRLKQSLIDVGFKGDFLGWRNCYPPGSPPHEQIPDAFKAYAFLEAMRQGYTSMLWLDASAWAVRPLEPMFDAIEKEGHLFFFNGHNVGEWCKDSALATLHLERESSFLLPDLTGLCFGLDYTHSRSKAFLDEFIQVCQDGVTLPGPFPGIGPRVKVGEISNDPRVKGHAHEQTVASALAHHHGMPFTKQPLWLQTKYPQDPVFDNAVILAAGM